MKHKTLERIREWASSENALDIGIGVFFLVILIFACISTKT